MRAAVLRPCPCKRAHRQRCVGRAECRQPGRGDRDALLFRKSAKRGHIAELALIGRHAQGRVALEMFDRAVALRPSQIDVS